MRLTRDRHAPHELAAVQCEVLDAMLSGVEIQNNPKLGAPGLRIVEHCIARHFEYGIAGRAKRLRFTGRVFPVRRPLRFVLCVEQGKDGLDLLARQDATAFVLGGLVRVQAGDRARTKAFTATESARIAELENFRSGAENSYLQTLPPQCGGGRDCEERFAYYRCVGAYELSSEFYRAIFDRFFTADQQKVLAPRLSSSGTVWQGALAMARNSHPFDQLPAPSRACGRCRRHRARTHIGATRFIAAVSGAKPVRNLRTRY